MLAKGAEQKRRQQVEEEAHACVAAAFQDFGCTLEVVSSFKYLGVFLTIPNNDWPVVVSNLRKEQRKWAIFPMILDQEGSDARNSGTFYKVVVQATLLFVSYTWVMTPRIGWILRGFHHRLAYLLEGMQPHHNTVGQWEYLPLEVGMAEVGLE